MSPPRWSRAATAASAPGAIALAHQADPPAQGAILAALDRIDPAALSVDRQLDLGRAYELVMVRLGQPPADAAARIAARLGPLFPSGQFELDRQLSSVLVAVNAPGIVGKLVAALAAPTGSAATTNLAPREAELSRLIERNAAYGSAVRSALEKRSDLLQIHYAYVLRAADKSAWTTADRKGYYEWFGRPPG